MSQQTINIGTTPSDGTGDSLLTAFGKVNANFGELYTGLAGKVGSSDLSAEATARESADTTLQGHIDAEATARESADTTLQGHIDAEATAREAADALLAPLDSPAFIRNPTAPTPAPGDNSNAISTTAFVKASIDALVAGAPSALDTLNEIATQLGNDESAVSALTSAVASKVPQTRTVNGHALSADVTLTKTDVGLGAVTNDAQLKASQLSTDGTMAGNSDSLVPSQKAVRAYVAANAGGGGSSILRALGTLQAYTSPSVDAAPPPNVSLSFQNVSAAYANIWIDWNGTTWMITFAPGGYNGGDFPIDSSSCASGSDYAGALLYILATNSGQFPNASVVSNDNAGNIVIANTQTGSSASFSVSESDSGEGLVSISGGGTGTDGSTQGGGAQEVVLATGANDKKVKMLSAFFDGSLTDESYGALFLRSPSSVDTQITNSVAGSVFNQLLPTSGQLSSWTLGLNAGESLVAKLTGVTATDGSTATVSAIFEQS